MTEKIKSEKLELIKQIMPIALEDYKNRKGYEATEEVSGKLFDIFYEKEISVLRTYYDKHYVK